MSDFLLPFERHLTIVLMLWLLPLIAYAIDMWTGIEAAKSNHEKLQSRRLRCTVVKIGEYWRLQLMAFLIDVVGGLLPIYNLPYLSMAACVCIILIEIFSVKENFRKRRGRKGVVEAQEILEGAITDFVASKTDIEANNTKNKIEQIKIKLNR